MSNVAIFIDYDNVSICLEKYYELYNDEDRSDLKTELINSLKKKYKNDRIITFKAFADFEKVKSNLTALQKNQIELRHIYSSNQRKNASDIGLAVDVIKSLYGKNNIDKYVLVSSDSDMLPILNEIRYFAKDAIVVYSKYGSVEGYENYISEYYIIEDVLGMSKYCPINVVNEVAPKLNHYMNLMNEGINYIYNKYSDNGTANKTNLTEYLYTKIGMIRNDILLIIEYLLKEGFLYESFIKGNNHKKIMINMARIKEFNTNPSNVIKISLRGNILGEKDYK